MQSARIPKKPASSSSSSSNSGGSTSAQGQNCFLGLEWAVESVKAVVCDEALEVVAAEEVRFESELPEYGTRGGVMVQQNTYALNVPVEMYIKALDLLLSKLTQSSLPHRIRSISGSAPSLLLPTTSFPPSFSLPAPSQPLHLTLSALLSHPFTPLPHPLTSPAHIPALLASLLPSLPPQTSALTTLPALLASLLTGAYTPPSTSELATAGGKLWNAARAEWDEQGLRELLKLGMGGGEDELGDAPARVREMMPRARGAGKEGEDVGRVAGYFVTRYGFAPDTLVYPFHPPEISTFLSLAPAPQTGVLALGTPDILLVPLSAQPPPTPTPVSALVPLVNRVWEREDASVVPHPAGRGEGWIAVIVSSYGEDARHQAMGKYTKTWTAFDRLVAVVPPGGTIGLDNKLFCFWGPQGQFRFRFGKPADFEDSRAIPRCLLESQMLHLRVRLSRLLAPPASLPRPLYHSSVPFDPYDPGLMPRRMVVMGTGAGYPAMAGVLGDVFFSTILVPQQQQVAPASAAAYPFPQEEAGRQQQQEHSRPALGAAYLARHAWRRAVTAAVDGRGPSFGDEVRSLLRRKHDALLARDRERERERGRERERESLVAKGVLKKASGFYAHAGSRLSTTMLAGSTVEPVEEVDETEEDEEGAYSGLGMGMGMGVGLGGALHLTPKHSPDLGGGEQQPRGRTTTGLSSSSSTNSFSSYSSSSLSHTTSTSSLTTLGTPLLPSFDSSPPPATPSAQAAAPGEWQGLPTDEEDVQLGLRKVADGDVDAFMGYGAVVPEFLRLERMLAMGFVV